MPGVQHIEIVGDEDGIRLDRWFKLHFPEISHGKLQKWLRKGEVKLDGKKTAANARIETGQIIRVPPITSSPEIVKPPGRLLKKDEDFIRSLVLYKGQDEIVINKPSGLAVQGGSKTARHIDGLLDGLKYDREEKPRLVHRLDRDTSGVMLLARSRKAASRLARSFKDQTIHKTYWALVEGVPRPHEGRIDMPLVKAGPMGQQKMRRADHGELGQMSAVSDFSLISHAGTRFSWLVLSPRTGRTHQLRVHMLEIGHPIYGDQKYTDQERKTDAADMSELGSGLHLHAASITFRKANGQTHTVRAPLPPHMHKSWALLGFEETLDHDPFEGMDI